MTKDYLTEEFDRNGWSERLRTQCTRIEYYNKPTRQEAKYPKGTVTVGYEYLDAENKRVALVFQYAAPDRSLCSGRDHHPKGLLIDGVWCYI